MCVYVYVHPPSSSSSSSSSSPSSSPSHNMCPGSCVADNPSFFGGKKCLTHKFG